MSKRQKAPAPSPSTSGADGKRTAILEAAKQAFSRYGYARTSMADVAQLAGVSRPALYEHFDNRADLYRSLAETLTEASLAAAQAAWPPDLSFREGLVAAVLAKDLELFRLVHLSPHGAELLNNEAIDCKDLHRHLETEFAALVTTRLGRKGAEAKAIGIMVTRAIEGLKQGAATEEELVASVRRLAAALSTGLDS